MDRKTGEQYVLTYPAFWCNLNVPAPIVGFLLSLKGIFSRLFLSKYFMQRPIEIFQKKHHFGITYQESTQDYQREETFIVLNKVYLSVSFNSGGSV